ncbi:type 4 prepilin-like protein [Synechocystis sp. LKSZ1]
MMVVVLIVGILAAIGTPSMIQAKAKSDLKDALGAVKGAIQEAQRIAVKKGQTCTLTFSSTSVTGTPTGCVPTAVTLANGITLSQNFSSNNLSFSFKGNTTSGGTIILSSTNTGEQKCLVISNGLGIFRTGFYANSTCTTSLRR